MLDSFSHPLKTARPQKAVDLNWQSSTRLLIHFGDAPCHGIRYHGGKQYSDNYPKGDPLGEREDWILTGTDPNPSGWLPQQRAELRCL